LDLATSKPRASRNTPLISLKRAEMPGHGSNLLRLGCVHSARERLRRPSVRKGMVTTEKRASVARLARSWPGHGRGLAGVQFRYGWGRSIGSGFVEKKARRGSRGFIYI
jgi:hypothetical protein